MEILDGKENVEMLEIENIDCRLMQMLKCGQYRNVEMLDMLTC